eukprot:gene2596-2898_t
MNILSRSIDGLHGPRGLLASHRCIQWRKVFLPLMVLDGLLMLPDYSVGPQDSREVAELFLGSSDALTNWSGSVTPFPPEPSQASPPEPSKLPEDLPTANPGIGLSPAAELLVVCVASLADEMLYRAVALTLLGLWIRDRLFEAGFDESVTLPWLHQELPTSDFARYGGVALIALLGAAGFAFGGLREVEAVKKLQVLDKDGKLAKSEQAELLKAQLVVSLGRQNLLMYGVEGLREVTASVMAGLAFVATSNLAAPLAGSIAVQVGRPGGWSREGATAGPATAVEVFGLATAVWHCHDVTSGGGFSLN